MNMHIDDFDEEVKRNYIRNEKLIDLKKIPEVLEKVIMVDFCEAGLVGSTQNSFHTSRTRD